MTDDDKLRAIAEEIKALPVAERLRLAADMLDMECPGVALAIVERVALEIGAALALRALGGRTR